SKQKESRSGTSKEGNNTRKDKPFANIGQEFKLFRTSESRHLVSHTKKLGLTKTRNVNANAYRPGL
ncbi:hypothetical protein, partial [Pseudomonas sp. RTS4]|uniref:hypothetical protein n=1 Tax=Pseudomonas sp. RTS4 TaxID=3048644 RepID=UPI002B23A564